MHTSVRGRAKVNNRTRTMRGVPAGSSASSSWRRGSRIVLEKLLQIQHVHAEPGDAHRGDDGAHTLLAE